jgi:hypothetical protein
MTAPELALVLGTRAALGVGLGMLLANRFSDDARRGIGGTLLLVGACLAGVIAAEGFGKPRPFRVSFGTDRSENDPRSGNRFDNRHTGEHLEVPVA